MRKVLISLLLAGAAATPAIASPHDWSNRQQAHDDASSTHQERQQAREERQQSRNDARPERQEVHVQRSTPQGMSGDFSRGERVNIPQQSFSGGARFEGRADRNVGGADQNARFEGRRDGRNVAVRFNGNDGDQVAPGPRVVTPPTGDFHTQERVRGRFNSDGDFRQSTRPLPNVMRTRDHLVVSNTPRPGTQPPLRTEGRRWSHQNWNTNWRHDGRYDWRHYRDRHRSIFHLGFYFDPFGWGYQPFQIGWRLWPDYYSSRYWIDDPYMYRLPYAPPGYRWIRYWNDALLVDTFTGEVVDEIPGFFW